MKEPAQDWRKRQAKVALFVTTLAIRALGIATLLQRPPTTSKNVTTPPTSLTQICGIGRGGVTCLLTSLLTTEQHPASASCGTWFDSGGGIPAVVPQASRPCLTWYCALSFLQVMILPLAS
jgi:hypothetical protein